jgi:hypothetical protein
MKRLKIVERLASSNMQDEMSQAYPSIMMEMVMINSINEGAMWHADPLLGHDCETSNYRTAIVK